MSNKEGLMLLMKKEATRRFAQRECPICGYTQLVVLQSFHDSLICEKCDYVIPAKKKVA